MDGRKGKVYDAIREFLSDDEWDEWLAGHKPQNKTLADALGFTESGVYRAKQYALSEKALAIANEEWEPEPQFRAMLGPSDLSMRQMIESNDMDGFESALSEAISGFKTFRDTFFEYQPGKPFITRQFHLDWMAEVLRTIYTGGRTMILSPPRHGKSELLVHFCVWLIIRNPDIRILWIGPNGDIAENMLGSVRDILQDDEALRKAFCAPTTSFRGDSIWSRTRFTVSTRTRHQKQPTMWCTGVSGRIHSLDCDFIVVDDPEDPDEAQTPAGREKTKNWFRIKVATRKMFWTGLVIISSRVHFDDLYSLYLDSERWNVVVNKAHDETACGRDVTASHEMVDRVDGGYPCVLFPELNPLEYLVEQEDTVGRQLFEMMYLNEPRPTSSMIFNPELLRERCLDLGRGLGTGGIEGQYRLVAGLDPAARQTQAGFLWAVTDDGHAFMVDLETQKAGGVEGAVSLIRQWADQYGCDLWVIEDVGYQKTFHDHPYIRMLKNEGFTIRPAHTGMNKHDPHFGVSGMARQYHEGKINLPYGDHAARRKTDMLIRELVMFTDDIAKQRKKKSDILMASWFPWSQVIKGWQRESKSATVKLDYRPSFPGLSTLTDQNMAPWTTAYPKGIYGR
jgi:hypothetical protein